MKGWNSCTVSGALRGRRRPKCCQWQEFKLPRGEEDRSQEWRPAFLKSRNQRSRTAKTDMPSGTALEAQNACVARKRAFQVRSCELACCIRRTTKSRIGLVGAALFRREIVLPASMPVDRHEVRRELGC